jgi:transposase-like protein
MSASVLPLQMSSDMDGELANRFESHEEEVQVDDDRRQRRKTYSMSFKLQVFREATETSRIAAANKFDVDRKRVREWLSNEQKILSAPTSRKRLVGAGRKPPHSAIDGLVLQWIRQRREAKQRVTRTMVMIEAKTLHASRLHGDVQLQASAGWLGRFMVRHGITMRRRTTLAQRVPANLADKVTSYITQIRHLRTTYKYSARCLAAMDETGLQLDMPASTTLEEQGARSVGITTTGHEKNRFTVVLGARADGSKVHPMTIFKGKRKDKVLEKCTGVVIEMQDNAWMTEELTLRWLPRLWGGIAATRERRMLVWDDFSAHKTERVKDCAELECNCDLMFVPPGCTSLIQAPDLCWNKPFKEKYDEFMMNGQFLELNLTQQLGICEHRPKHNVLNG